MDLNTVITPRQGQLLCPSLSKDVFLCELANASSIQLRAPPFVSESKTVQIELILFCNAVNSRGNID